MSATIADILRAYRFRELNGLTDTRAPHPPEDPLLASYAQLAKGLIGQSTGVCLFDHKLRSRGHFGLELASVERWVSRLHWLETSERATAATSLLPGQWLTAIPLEQSDGALLGVFCIQEARTQPPARPAQYAGEMRRSLKPLLDCIHREMAGALPAKSRIQILTERAGELEWLFRVTSKLKGSVDEKQVLQELLDGAARRLQSELGVIYIPGRRLCLERVQSPVHAAKLLEAWRRTKTHLLTWAQRHSRPLIVSGNGGKEGKLRCKILSVPVVRDSGQVIGVLGFYNPETAQDFATRHVFLARHLGRQAAGIVESQFDLMTGLYTRGGLEQASGQLLGEVGDGEISILYIDVDHMHVLNELHGFELGNEMIVRIAGLLAPPLLPDRALAGRISADRFAVMLPLADMKQAAACAEAIRLAASRLKIGPAESAVDVSITCGVAPYVAMPQGLDRALATAELACKAAKGKGRNRVEVYASDDNSMIRRHDDVIAVGQLRAALKADRLVLFAQRIVPLRSTTLANGYEILVRILDDAGGLVMPGPLIRAAQRYQLLPSLDRWVTARALEMLTPYRSILSSRGVGISINVSGQSICDETFVTQLAQQIESARLPQDCITVEITEQSAVTNLARANQLIRQLKSAGCQIALDDFGTGANSLMYLKHLQISRVKIDGSFVRDVATDRNSRSTVRAIVELAAGMSIDTVAEFVETEEIADEMRALGVDFAQGYAFGKPEPLDRVLAALGDDESRRLHRLFLES
jgi:diguanylate cyclase (GGDEF)-like protein